jgi:UPF0716 family protein affecting phage T7 exclusion
LAFVAHLLNITGLVYDVMALLVAVAPLRRWLFRLLGMKQDESSTHFSSGFTTQQEDIIEGEFEDLSQGDSAAKPENQLPTDPQEDRHD